MYNHTSIPQQRWLSYAHVFSPLLLWQSIHLYFSYFYTIVYIYFSSEPPIWTRVLVRCDNP